MCIAAVSQCGYVLRCIPDILQNERTCLTAVNNDGLALKYVPVELRDRREREKLGQARIREQGAADAI